MDNQINANSVITYNSAFGEVSLSKDVVKGYLVKGNSEVTDQEVVLFMEMCKAQKLNPFVSGEVHLIKFGSTPAQMVIGYDTYKRRAEDNPDYLYNESGIIVQRGNEIVKKEGACIYPSETLVGGWCKVYKARQGTKVSSYKEVGFGEYNKGNAIWKEKPCTMIEKVAVSQALRAAFPKEYEGIYTKEELAPAEYSVIYEDNATKGEEQVQGFVDTPITQDERREMFAKAKEVYGEKGNEIVKAYLDSFGVESSIGMMKSIWLKIMQALDEAKNDNKEASEK